MPAPSRRAAILTGLISSSLIAAVGATWGLLPTAAQAAPRSELRVLLQNIYGRSEKSCEERFQAIARKIHEADPPYDIVVFNEHWKVRDFGRMACDADVLTRAMRAPGRYRQALLHRPKSEALWQMSGGNSIFSLHPLREIHSFQFTEKLQFPVSGATLARVSLPDDREIDVWFTHIEAGSDGCDDFCRLGQVDELASAVAAFREAEIPVLIAGDFNTGGPMSYEQLVNAKQALETARREASDGGRLVWYPKLESDLKAHREYAGNAGYFDLLETLGDPMDLWLWTHPRPGREGLFAGATYDCDRNNLLSCSYRERIDYLFAVPPKSSGAPAIVPSKVDVVRWKSPSGLDVSDHYGLDARLMIGW